MSNKTSKPAQNIHTLHDLWSSYTKETPQSLKFIDAYLFFILLSGVIQFTHCVIVGTYPYNAFLAGFISTVGSFVLAGKVYDTLKIFLLKIIILMTTTKKN